MYNINDKSEVIKEIKRYLYAISTTTRPEIGRTTIDGYYDKETERIIKNYQRAIGIPENGIVDYITFQNLADEYLKITKKNNTRQTLLLPTGFPLSRGMANEDIRLINIIITSLREIYKELPFVGASNYFSKNTERAIHLLREIFMMRDSGEVDSELFERMIIEIDTENRKKKTNDLKVKTWA